MPKLDNQKVSFKEWNGFKIKSVETPKVKSGCYNHILNRIHRIMHLCLLKRSRVLSVRIDLRYRYTLHSGKRLLDNNITFTGFISNYVKSIRRKENFCEYLWAREVSSEGREHYHVVLFFDGSKHQQGYKIQMDIKDRWDRYIKKHKSRIADGMIDRCDNSTRRDQKRTATYMLKRNDGEGKYFKKCFERLSYLAKENSKREIPFGNNNRFGSSIIPKDFEVDRTMIAYGAKRSLLKSEQ